MGGALDGKVALVTGGSSGIGRATARLFAAEGAAVVIADLDEAPREGGAPTHETIEASGGTARFVRCDVTAARDRAAAVAAAEELGGLDVLMNNAGIFRGGAFVDVTEDDFDRMNDLNVKAAFFMAQAAAAAMVRSGGGSIVNLSSVGGIQGAGGFSLYCLTKGSMRLLTYSIAEELGPHNIRVNALHPGFIETSMTTLDVAIVGTPAADSYLDSIPLRRSGSPDDVARAALFLASDLSGYVTGSSVTVDGGRMRV